MQGMHGRSSLEKVTRTRPSPISNGTVSQIRVPPHLHHVLCSAFPADPLRFGEGLEAEIVRKQPGIPVLIRRNDDA